MTLKLNKEKREDHTFSGSCGRLCATKGKVDCLKAPENEDNSGDWGMKEETMFVFYEIEYISHSTSFVFGPHLAVLQIFLLCTEESLLTSSWGP